MSDDALDESAMAPLLALLVAGLHIRNRRRRGSVPAGGPLAMVLARHPIAGDDACHPPAPGTTAMPRHIGIVACSAEGAALCYRTICTEGPELLGRYAHP